MCVRCRCDVLIEPLTSNIYIQAHRLMGGIYDHDKHTKFHKGWFRHSEVNSGGYTDSMVI
jgi:hypothetical protein